MANTLNAPNTEQMWRAATPLSSAHLLTATEDETKIYRALLKLGGGYAVFTQMDSSSIHTFKDIMNSDGFKKMSEFNGLNSALCNRLRQQLLSGELIGLGYAQPRLPDASPQLIARDTWSGHIKPNKEEVSHAGLQYLGVRVITYKKAFANFPPISDTPSVDTKPLGRPSLRPYILKAYSALKADGKIDFNNSLKAHASIISWWVSQNYPDAMGKKTEIDYTTIQRTIGNQFRDRN